MGYMPPRRRALHSSLWLLRQPSPAPRELAPHSAALVVQSYGLNVSLMPSAPLSASSAFRSACGPAAAPGSSTSQHASLKGTLCHQQQLAAGATPHAPAARPPARPPQLPAPTCGQVLRHKLQQLLLAAKVGPIPFEDHRQPQLGCRPVNLHLTCRAGQGRAGQGEGITSNAGRFTEMGCAAGCCTQWQGVCSCSSGIALEGQPLSLAQKALAAAASPNSSRSGV